MTMSAKAFINCSVGGMHYSLLQSDVQRHLASYFASAIKDEWRNCDDKNTAIVINRDGELFQHIFSYIYMNEFQLPARLSKDPMELLVAIRAEADYFNLSHLVTLCDAKIQAELVPCCSKQLTEALCKRYKCVRDGSEPDDLVNVYTRHSYPSFTTGRATQISTINVPAMLNVAFTEDEPHTSTHFIDEYDENVDERIIDQIRQIYNDSMDPPPSGREFSTNVFILTEGAHYNNFAPFQAFSHFGEALYILQAPESGGMITVAHNGVKQSIRQAGEYILCGRDCTREIELITSGVLVFILLTTEYRSWPAFAWTVSFHVRNHDLGPALQVELVDAVHRDIHSAQGVVLCLRRLYAPMVAYDYTSALPLLQLETDPAALQGRDAHLFAALVPHFDITLVTVCIARPSKQPQNYQACVLGLPLAPDDSVTNEDSTKIKIIMPPLQSHEWYQKDTFRLLTGLYIQRRN